ncbi:hypothetical protein CFC21_035963 [Triticum aestivum]|uniref:DNA-directed RNA polymerase III subunit RPC3 n=4 Tax=Triticum TaxID=4564 RepID=A0A9R0VMY7_TRITD|nr:DNA-directed RNA polymerase III subunit RPC3-like [Triticum aestivum]KAF7023458.1 hypothetical protein CFC21_035963 [Triticum aestivum]VAH63273.1 unnamed protein product [Triticum turgidum subsp. durum]
MVSQHGILLAAGLISDHFGPLVAKVCDCLLRHGALQLTEIVRRLKLPQGQVKNSLLVLIQHNCVQAFSSPRGDRTITLYLAIFDNVLHRLRFSKFISVIRAAIPESETLIEGLLQNGRLTFDQLVGRTISKVPEGTIRPAREEIRMNFNKLVYARYVERCPKAEPYFNPQEDEQSTAARRRVPKTAEEVLSLKQKVVNTATLSDPERFSEIPYGMEDASKTNDCPHNAVAGAKRKHGAFEVDEELNSTIAENEVLWRVNFEKFIFCLKKKFCADRKKPKLKVGTHPIWESFFEANLTDKDTNSVTSSTNGILEKLGQKEGTAAMTIGDIKPVLLDLQCTTSDGEEFTFDLRKMVEACRNEEIESLVKKKYGQEAFTIFRLLVTQGCAVETDQIIDTTILDKQIVHSTLYKLWNDGYIDTEKIASAAGTGYAQFFVWRAKNTFREQFIDNLYHAALNLRQMVNYIAELLLEGSKDETKLRNRKNILILALTRHDDSLMLFHDF